MRVCQQIAVYILIADLIIGTAIALVWMVRDFLIGRNMSVKGWDD